MRIFLATAIFVIATTTASYADDWHKSWPVAGQADVHIDVDDGRITAIASDRKDVEASVRSKATL